MKWINNVPDIYDDIVDIVNLIQHIDFKHITDLIDAISKILTLVSKILQDLEPWASGPNSDYLHKVINAFAHADIVKIAMNILLNGGQVLKDITDAINSFNTGNFGSFGKDIGDFLYLTVLQQTISLSPDDILKLVEGLLTGLRFPDMDSLIKWISNVPDITTKLE